MDTALISAGLFAAVALRTLPALQPAWEIVGLPHSSQLFEWSSVHTALLLFQVITIPFALAAIGLYFAPPDRRHIQTVVTSVSVVAAVHVTFLAFLFLLKESTIPRGVLVIDFLFVSAALPAWRIQSARTARRRIERGEGLSNALIVGAGPSGQDIAAELIVNPQHGRRIVGFLTEEPLLLNHLPPHLLERPDVWVGPKVVHPLVDEAYNGNGNGRAHFENPRESHGLKSVVVANVKSQPRHLLTRVGRTSLEDVTLALDGLFVEEVYLTPGIPRETMLAIVRACRERGAEIHLVPQHYPELATNPSPWKLGPHTVMSIYSPPLSRVGQAFKRALDIVGGIAGLVVAAPIILVTALAIKLENPRLSVFYQSPRVGRKGRQFRMMKFTTMRPDAQRLEADLVKHNTRDGPWFKIGADLDPRLTRVGRVLRKYSINEIPQLLNIISGDMSLVGPRPPLPDEVASYAEYDFRYYRCLDVKPGLTGLWQVRGRTDPSFDKRIEMDLEYIQNWSFWLDLKLILETPRIILTEHEE